MKILIGLLLLFVSSCATTRSVETRCAKAGLEIEQLEMIENTDGTQQAKIRCLKHTFPDFSKEIK